MDIRTILKRELSARGLTGNKVAKAAGVPSRTAYDFLDGKGPINSDALGRIADVLGLKLLSEGELQSEADRRAEEQRLQEEKERQVAEGKLAEEIQVLSKVLSVLARENPKVFSQVADKIGPDPDPSVDFGKAPRPHVVAARLMRRAKASRKRESDSVS